MPHAQQPGIPPETSAASPIVGAPTSIAAFVGIAEQGPYDTPILITSWYAFVAHFGNPCWFSFLPWAVQSFFSGGGTACYVQRVQDSGSGAPASAALGGITLAASSPGDWGNALRVCVGNQGSPDSQPTPVFKLAILVDAALIDGADVAHCDLATQMLVAHVKLNALTATQIGGANFYPLETFAGLTASTNLGAQINGASRFVRVTANDGTRPLNTAMPLAFTGGSQPDWDFATALSAVVTVPSLSLLALPDVVTLTDDTGCSDLARQSQLFAQALAQCENAGNLVLVVDPPFGLDVAGVVAYKTGAQAGCQALGSSYGAMYYPWVARFDGMSTLNFFMPPSGEALGRYAYTDDSVGVWKAPAGINDGALRDVVALAAPLSENDCGTLNPQGINPIRNLINYGTVIWGARSLSSDPQRVYVSVQRLLIYVEQSLKQGLQWTVFEPNDARLQASVCQASTAFLTTLWQQGAFFGATAAEAFAVICDASNNPPAISANGLLNLDVMLAPVYPAEFVALRIVLPTATTG